MKIACYNIQNISEEKIKNEEIVDQIAKIICNYDIMFILELSDKSSKKCDSPVLDSIVRKLNNKLNNELNKKYSYYANEKQGSTACTAERIGIIYNNEAEIKIDINSSFNKIEFTNFVRNPFIVPINIYNENYIFIINHITPSNVNNELNSLNDVFNNLYDENKDKKFILMGDYNADGSFLSNTNEKKNKLFNNKNLICLTNNEKTNVSENEKRCYDRVLCSTNCLINLNNVDNDEGNNTYCDVDNLRYLNLNIQEIKKISDHYPVFIEIIKST